MFGAAFRQEYLRRMTFQHYNEETDEMEYYFKNIPSKEINDEATLEEMWTEDEMPSFLLETGFVSLKYDMSK